VTGFCLSECSSSFWRELGGLILVEAKHWQAQRVGKNEYVQFTASSKIAAAIARSAS